MDIIMDKIVINGFEDGIFEACDGEKAIYQYTAPYGDKKLNEIGDARYLKSGYKMPYHYNDRGAVSYIILQGSIEITLYGKTCVCEAGDIINIPANLPYGFITLEDETVIREMFTGMDVLAKRKDRELLTRNALSYACDAEFIAEDFDPKHGTFALAEPVDTEVVEKESLPQVTAENDAIYEYGGWEGLYFKLKVGRWNLKNVKEIWEITIDKGYRLEYLKPTANEALYTVKSGSVKVDVDGEELIAEAGDIIHIPQYTPFAITAIDEDTMVYDLDVSSRLFRLLEMLQLAQRDEADKVADPEWMAWLLDMNDSDLTGLVKTELAA
jgi:quercetin dioxygenase-like cupin family protein